MSYFNSDQEDYINSLSKIPANEKCWCGWYKFNECYDCKRGKYAEQTLQDRLNLEQIPKISNESINN